MAGSKNEVSLLVYLNFNSLYKLWSHQDSRAIVISNLTVTSQKVLRLRPKTNQNVVTEFSQALIK